MNPTPPCTNTVRDDLKAYVDNELAPRRRFIVGRHLAHCAACRQEIEELKTVSEKLQAAENAAPALAPALRSRILTQIEQAAPAAGSPIATSPLWRRKPLLVWGGGGAAVAASALAFAVVYNPAKQMAASEASQNTAAVSGVKMYQQEYDEAYADRWKGGLQTESESARPSASGAGRGIPAPGAPAATADSAASEPGAIVMGRIQEQKADKIVENAPRTRSVAQAARRPQPSNAEAPLSSTFNFERQVHREASIGVSVAEIEAASNKVEEMVKTSGGFVASNNLSTDDASGDKTADLTVRVPVADFDTMMLSFAKLGAVVSKSVTGEDITEKTSDATSAEQVLTDEVEASQKRLRSESMSERRTGQKEAELRELRLRLAQTRARLGLLRKMAALSTINISLIEKHKKAAGTTVPTNTFFAGMQETNRSAALAFQSAVRVPLVLVIWVLAFSPIWVPLVLAYRWAALKTLANANTAHPSEPPIIGGQGG